MTNTVYLTGVAIAAQTEPQFIIKKGDVYYLTKAIWEYDFDNATTDDQRNGVTQIANQFNDLAPGGDLVARERPGGAGGGDPNQTFA